MPDDAHPNNSRELTVLLQRASDGEQAAAVEVLGKVEAELRKIAAAHMRRERQNHTLQTTALVNEAYMQLFGREEGSRWKDRAHFFAVASRVIRHLLVDHARAKQAGKRDGVMVSVDEVGQITDSEPGSHSSDRQATVLDVHLALEELERHSPRQAKLVELKYFCGLSLEEAAKVLEISPRAADKDWAFARAWLKQRLRAGYQET